MNSEPASRRERLLDLDPPAGSARVEYERALSELFERRLGGFGRARYALLAAAGAIGALGMASLALTEPATTPDSTRVVLWLLAGIGATWFVVASRLVRRGSVHLISDRRRIAAIVLCFAVLQCGFFAWISWRRAELSLGCYVGLVGLLLASVGLIVQHVREAELRIREQILRTALARVDS